ncbi:MAG: DnaJ domain-containing protein [Synechocystis sp.]|nr:DnaJ domain-containing protein [Synechocystis sp.]
MIDLSSESGFVIVGAASGQIFASQVGGIGLVGSFGGLAIGTPVIVISGALAGAAVQGIIEGIKAGDVTVLGVTTVGSVLGAGFAASVGNVGVGVAGTAFGIGIGTMTVAGGIFAIGAYQLVKKFIKKGQAESFDSVLSRLEDNLSVQEFYLQALLDLDPVLQELTWYQKFSDLDTDQELQAMKQQLGLDSSQGEEWQLIDKPEALQTIIDQLTNQFKDCQPETIYSSSSSAEKASLITIDLPELAWQAIELRHFENPPILSLVISQDNRTLYTSHQNGTVYQWDLEKHRHSLTYISSGEEILAVAISPDRQKLFAAGFEPFITAWNTDSQTISMGFRSLSLKSNRSHEGIIHCLACSPDGGILASGGSDGVIKLWDALKNTWKRNLNGHQGCIRAIAFRFDGQTIISGGEDCTIRLWQVNDWQKSLILGEHPTKIIALSLNSTGQFLVSASLDGTVKIWDLDQQCCLTVFQAHNGNLLGMAVNPITNLIATATAKEVRLWDWQTQRCSQSLAGSFPLGFSPDGQRLITVNTPGRKGVKIWQLQPRETRNGHHRDVSFDAFSPWWDVFNVSPNADRQSVKAAYYALAKQFHPDQSDHYQGQDQRITIMQQINRAYEQFRQGQEA